MTVAARDAGRSASARPLRMALVTAILALTIAVTWFPASQAQTVYDPIEPINRAVFTFNDYADQWVLEPVARFYRLTTPMQLRRSVSNFLSNLRSPVVFANDLMQGQRERAGITLGRFMINTTLGIFGLFDAASTLGYAPHWEDFGQTLGTYGVPPGPYLVLPLLGPSNARDTVGIAGDYFINPLNQCCITGDERLGIYGTDVLSQREANIEVIDDLRANSLDVYATVRSAYAQKRAADIRNGAAAPDQGEYDDIFKEAPNDAE